MRACPGRSLPSSSCWSCRASSTLLLVVVFPFGFKTGCRQKLQLDDLILLFFSFFLFCRVLLPPPVQAANNYTLAPATEQSFSSVCLTLITTTQMGRAGEMCKWPADEKQPINNNAGMELKNKRDGRLVDAAGANVAGVNTSPSSSRFSVRPR